MSWATAALIVYLVGFAVWVGWWAYERDYAKHEERLYSDSEWPALWRRAAKARAQVFHTSRLLLLAPLWPAVLLGGAAVWVRNVWRDARPPAR
jgi:hypothetical protein